MGVTSPTRDTGLRGELRNSDPAGAAVALTKSDSTVIEITRGLYVGGTGDVAVLMADGVSCIFESVPAGFILPVRCTKLLSTGTSATKVVALY